MSESTGDDLLPVLEVTLTALGASDEDWDLVDEATRLASAIDAAEDEVTALCEFGPQLFRIIDLLGGTPMSRTHWKTIDCIACGKRSGLRRRRRARTCGAGCSELYRQARIRNREHIRRSTVSDITPEQELAMRRKARKCPMPGCGVRLTDKLGLPNSKHLDHIIPLAVLGTHTHGNVRIICAACNLKRPKDGSDYSGPVTLWAQGEILVGRPDRRRGRTDMANTVTCRKGLHPWVPENIKLVSGKKRCAACYSAKEKRKRKSSDVLCKCGTLFTAAGNTLMCPGCQLAAVRTAIFLRTADELTWGEIAVQVGYSSGTGISDAVKRAGYCEPKREVEPKAVHLCGCGRPVNGGRQCQSCAREAAHRAVSMRTLGYTLRQIADEIGYSSITSVTNLMKTVTVVEAKIGRPRTVTS